MNPQSKELKEIRNLHAIIVEILVTHQTNAGVMEKQNSMESASNAISMVIKPMNVMKNLNLTVNVTNAKDMVTRHQNEDPNHSI